MFIGYIIHLCSYITYLNTWVMVKYNKVDGGKSGAISKLVKKSS